MHRLGDPQDKLRYVHVVGTNGKGSTTSMIAHSLTAAGYRTGMFISPFILDFRERMQIDGEMISPEALASCCLLYTSVAGGLEVMSYTMRLTCLTSFTIRRDTLSSTS